MRVIPFLAAALALSLVGSASADHCRNWTTHDPEVDTCQEGAPPPCLYVATDYKGCDPECWLLEFWIYMESNGIAGLQRNDETVDDTCHGMIVSDTIIF